MDSVDSVENEIFWCGVRDKKITTAKRRKGIIDTQARGGGVFFL